LTLPDKATRYYPIKAALSPGETHLLTVVEVKGKRSTWKVLLDGKTVSPEITLPGSHNRFAPQILAENWNAGTRKCNDYSYSFRDIRIALAPGGSWRLPKPGYLWRDRHNQAVRLSRDAFVARSTDLHTAAGDDVPPALGPLADGKEAHCRVHKAGAVRPGATGEPPAPRQAGLRDPPRLHRGAAVGALGREPARPCRRRDGARLLAR
jgi:hypothetical protein